MYVCMYNKEKRWKMGQQFKEFVSAVLNVIKYENAQRLINNNGYTIIFEQIIEATLLCSEIFFSWTWIACSDENTKFYLLYEFVETDWFESTAVYKRMR